LYGISGIQFGTSFAQLVASLIIFDGLSFDQKFLIAAGQQVATVQLITSGFLCATLLNVSHFILCVAQSALSLAYGIMTFMHDHKPLEKQCLTLHWPTAGGAKPSLHPDILAMVFAILWILVLGYVCYLIYHFHNLRKLLEIHSQIIKNPQLPFPEWLLLSSVCHWCIMAYFTVMIYTSAAHLKQNRSDHELKTFGQILALCTVGTSVWQLVWSKTS
jgi:hypothetical protein